MVCTWLALQPISFFVWMYLARSVTYRQETLKVPHISEKRAPNEATQDILLSMSFFTDGLEIIHAKWTLQLFLDMFVQQLN